MSKSEYTKFSAISTIKIEIPNQVGLPADFYAWNRKLGPNHEFNRINSIKVTKIRANSNNFRRAKREIPIEKREHFLCKTWNNFNEVFKTSNFFIKCRKLVHARKIIAVNAVQNDNFVRLSHLQSIKVAKKKNFSN